jgi:Rab-like protein 5
MASLLQEIERSLGRKRFSIQLWDCSGDDRFQNCWPALQNGAQGLILVRNGTEPLDEQDKQLENW